MSLARALTRKAIRLTFSRNPAISGGGMYMVLDLLHVPISLTALGVGVGTITPIAFSMLIGGIVGLILRLLKSKEWWDKNRMIMGAGLIVGEGLAVTLSIGIALIINSIWTMPW